MAYVGPIWKNDPDHSSPINAENLEIMDNGITQNDRNITSLNDNLTEITGNIIYNNFVDDGYYRLNTEYVDPTDITINPVYPNKHMQINCNGGDAFTISGQSYGAAARMYAFTDGTYRVLSVASQGATLENEVIVAPTGATILFVNNYRDSMRLFKNKTVVERFNETNAAVSDLNTKTTAINKETKSILENISVYNTNRFTGNYIADYRLNESGELVPTQANWNTTDFCYVADCEKVTFSAKIISTGNRAMIAPYYLCGYDKDLNFVTYAGSTPAETYTVPSGVEFIRFCYHPNLTVDIQAESGTGRSDYIPFDYRALEKALKNIINSSLKNKKVTVIGDSITEHNSTAAKNWTTYLQELTACNVQNLGISGTGFYNSNPYKNRLNQIDSDTDIIGVAISFNDIGKGVDIGTYQDRQETTLCGYAYVCLSQLQTMFPATPIIVYSQGPWASYHFGGQFGSGGAYIEELKKMCNRMGIPVYDELYFNGSGLRPWDANNQERFYKNETTGNLDNVHPNSEGHKIIANYLVPKFEQNIANI